jgi:hypothetical protein
MDRFGRFVKDDFHWHALHHLNVVPRGILRRQEAERRPRAQLEALDVPFEGMVGICVIRPSAGAYIFV